MSNLEVLDLSGTQIAALPRSMLLLKNLRFLNVSSTQIGSLPEWLSDMEGGFKSEVQHPEFQ
jgi:Leucine-rich repeat (LRR) protein